MNFKVATITALVIGILVAMVGMFPVPREAAIAFFRGESRFGDWANWKLWGRRTADAEIVAAPPETSGRHSPSDADGRPSNTEARPVVADRRAEDLLAKSIAMLERCPSIAAKTRQTVYLYGKHLVGSGEYLEQRDGPSRMFRVELKMQVGNELRTLLHVCDGRYMWRCESYKGKGTAERVDLARAARALDGRVELGTMNKMGEWTRLGGLSELLRDLRDWFQFTTVAAAKLPDQTPVMRLEGVWKPDRLTALMPEPRPQSKSADAVASRLPEHLPDRVILFLGRDDLFPFRVEYRRRTPQLSLMPGAEEDSAMVTMDLFEAKFNVPMDRSRFSFTPGNLEYSNQTDRFLERLGVEKKP